MVDVFLTEHIAGMHFIIDRKNLSGPPSETPAVARLTAEQSMSWHQGGKSMI